MGDVLFLWTVDCGLIEESTVASGGTSPRILVLVKWFAVFFVIGELVLRIIFHSWGAFFYQEPASDRFNAPLNRILYAFGLLHGNGTEVQSPVYEPDHRRGHRLRPGLRHAIQYGAPVSSNSLGTRGLREVSTRRAAGVVRIVTLGDSYTFGENVGDEDAWPAQVESLLEGTEVINFGISAYAHDQMHITLLDEVLDLRPDVVLLGFVMADIARNTTPRFCGEKPIFVERDGKWVLENVPVPTPDEIQRRYTLPPLMVSVPLALAETLRVRAVRPYLEVRDGIDVTRHLIREMASSCRENDIRFIPVFIPGPPPEPKDGWPDRHLFLDLCAGLELECVDTSPAFEVALASLGYREFLASLVITNDHHYNGRGYELIAGVVARHLGRQL